MRICATMNVVDPLAGGPPRAALGFFERIARRGHRVDLHTPTLSDRAVVLLQEHTPGLQIHQYPASLDWIWAGGGTSMGNLVDIVDRADLIYNVSTWNYNQLRACQMALRRGIPVVIAPHENLSPGPLAVKAAKKKLAWMAFQRKLVDRASAMHAMTQTESEHLRALTRTPVFVAPFGLDAPVAEAPRRVRPGEGGPIRLLFLARLVPIKGLPRAFQLLRALRAHGRDATLDVVGDGHPTYAMKLRALARRWDLANRIRWHGWLEGDDKWRVLQASDVLLIPSDFEGTSLAMLEALSQGVPALRSSTSRLSGIGPAQGVVWVEDEDWGGESCARLVERMLADYPALSSAGLAYVSENHDWDRNVNRLEQELSRIVGDARPRKAAGPLSHRAGRGTLAPSHDSVPVTTPGAQPRPRVSALIASRNRPGPVRRCMESILEQDYKDLEIVVFDDHTDAGPLQDLAQLPATGVPVRFHRSPAPTGVVGARNWLMRNGLGDYLVLFDDDAFLRDPTTIRRIVETLDREPDIGILAGQVIDRKGQHDRILIPLRRRLVQRDPGLAERAQLVSYYVGAFHVLRRDLVDQCGVYQEDLVFGEEELDLSYRAVQAGFHLLYDPSFVAHHEQQTSVLGDSQERHRKEIYYSTRNRIYLAYRYLPTRYFPTYLFVWLGLIGIRAVRLGFTRDYLRGLAAGARNLQRWKRQPMDRRALRYLRAHHGRLWY